MESPETLREFLEDATRDGAVRRLLYRGAAWSLMRSNGVFPVNGPALGATIETDLAEHGFALLRAAMALRKKSGASELTDKAFERAANAFEALVRNGKSKARDRGFLRTLAASAYHLAGYSAVAYSLFNEIANDLNLAPGIQEEPLSQLIERLDATVFGLIEALDADQMDLPRLLDEALRGSLWARQITREGDGVEDLHKMILRARANLIWSTSTFQARKGHFAMGVGLEAGLAIDAMADELSELVDRADAAALDGDVEELATALNGLAERLLVIRPFVPDKTNSLPSSWRDLLKKWVSGEGIGEIGPPHMKVVEDAFCYRLVWALEAIRTRRMSAGWTPENIAGGAAATVETGVPQYMMAMLVRAGLPSRKAAIAAIRSAMPLFVTPAEMRVWLDSDEVTELTDSGEWPTEETSALWARFRTEALSGGIQKWFLQRQRHLLDLREQPTPFGLFRIATDEGDGRTWLVTPDFERVVPFRQPALDPKPSLLFGRLHGGTPIVEVSRMGRSFMQWPGADS